MTITTTVVSVVTLDIINNILAILNQLMKFYSNDDLVL